RGRLRHADPVAQAGRGHPERDQHRVEERDHRAQAGAGCPQRGERAAEALAVKSDVHNRQWAGYLFLSPALLLFLLFVAGPVIAAIVLAFFEWDLLTPARFTGFGNFTAMFSDPLLYK